MSTFHQNNEQGQTNREKGLLGHVGEVVEVSEHLNPNLTQMPVVDHFDVSRVLKREVHLFGPRAAPHPSVVARLEVGDERGGMAGGL